MKTVASVILAGAVASRVAYDPDSKRYLVVWVRHDGRVEAIFLDAAGVAVTEVFTVLHSGQQAFVKGAP